MSDYDAQITVHCSAELKAAVEVRARINERTVSQEIRHILRQALLPRQDEAW